MNTLVPLRHRLLVVLFFLTGAFPAFSQIFNVLTPPSPANYPTVTTNVQVLVGGESKRDFKDGDFEVSEGGPFVPATVKCAPVGAKPAVDILLVNDISVSMIEPRPDGISTRLQLLQSGLEAFLEAVDFTTGTAVGITTFAEFVEMPSNGFRSGATAMSVLSPIPPSLTVATTLGTLYNRAFLDPTYGALNLFKKRPINPAIPRIIIFLTDGQPTDFPKFDKNPVIAQALNATDGKVIIFSIMLDKSMNPDLMAISQATGGQAYEMVTSPEQIIGIYRQIADKIQGIQPCVLSWTSEVQCGEENRQRKVQIRYKPANQIQKATYLAPPESVASLDQPYVASFGDPVVGEFSTVTITITAKNKPFHISSDPVIVGDATFKIIGWGGGATLPIDLAPGESTTLTVQFAPTGTQTYRSAKLNISASPCNAQTIALWGGALPIDKPPVTLFNPNGGELLSKCTPILITWGGIPSYVPVTLSYSDDGGNNWKEIIRDVVDSVYSWLPPGVGMKYLIRVENTQNYANWVWARKAGGAGMDRALGVAADKKGNAYVLGEYSGAAVVDTIKLLQPGKRFLACYNAQGNAVWAVKVLNGAQAVAQDRFNGTFTYVITTATISQYASTSGTLLWTVTRNPGPTRTETLRDIAVDGTGAIYVTGYYVFTGESQMYIVKYDASKNLINGAGNGWKNFSFIVGAQPSHIVADNTGNVLVSGTYNGSAGFLKDKIPPGGFIIKYDREGNFQWVMSDGTPNGGAITTAALAYKDEGDFFYQTGSFDGNGATFGGKILTGIGKSDAFLVKYDATSKAAQWATKMTNAGNTNESSVDVDVDATGNPCVAGWFDGPKINFTSQDGSVSTSVSNSSSTGGRKDLFVTKYTSDGVPFFAASGGGLFDDKSVAIAANNSRCFMVGNFSGGLAEHPKFGAFSMTAGDTDLVIGSISVILKGSDTSNAVFEIAAPQLVGPDTLDLGEEFVGTSGQHPLDSILHNNGNEPLRLRISLVIGTNPNDFIVVPKDIEVPPHDSTDLYLNFAPSALGKRVAFLIVEGDCIPKDTIVLIGIGKPVCITTIEKYDVDSSNVNQAKNGVFNAAFCNKGPLAINVDLKFIGANANDYTFIVNSTPQKTPTIHLEPNECADLTIQFTPSTSGNRNAQINLSVQGCSDFQAQVVGFGIPGSASIAADNTFIDVVDCNKPISEKYVYIENLGGSDLKIESIVIKNDNQGFTVLPLVNPLVIPKFGRDSVKVSFAPLTPGAKTADLEISSSNAANSPFTIQLSGRKDFIQISGSTLPFGTLTPSDFALGGKKKLTLTNTGSVPTKLSGTIPGTNFKIISGLPVDLLPGGTVDVEIEFVDPGQNGDYEDSLYITPDPNCGVFAFFITGRRATAEAHLAMPVVTADVHAKDFHIPITLTPGVNFTLAMNNTYTIKVRFNQTMFRPHSFTNGASMSASTTVGDDREITITGKAAGPNAGPLTEIIGDVLLGNAEQTHLLVSVDNWDDLAVSTDSGSLSVEGICRDGGARLTETKSNLAIKKVAPNPAGKETEIEVQTLEVGEHVLEIYDMNGRSVFHHHWNELVSPLSGEHIIPVGTSQFPVGVYQIIVRTPTRILKEILSVVH